MIYFELHFSVPYVDYECKNKNKKEGYHKKTHIFWSHTKILLPLKDFKIRPWLLSCEDKLRETLGWVTWHSYVFFNGSRVSRNNQFLATYNISGRWKRQNVVEHTLTSFYHFRWTIVYIINFYHHEFTWKVFFVICEVNWTESEIGSIRVVKIKLLFDLKFH